MDEITFDPPPSRYRVPQRKRNEAVRLLKLGLKPGDVARRLGIGRHTLFDIRKEAGLLASQRVATDARPAGLDIAAFENEQEASS